MPNWCACYLEVESKKFKESLFYELNEDKIALMSLLLIRLPKVNFDNENLFSDLTHFFSLDNTIENLKQFEQYFEDNFPKELWNTKPLLDVMMTSGNNSFFPRIGEVKTEKHPKHVISGDWFVKKDTPGFSFFKYIKRPIGLHVAEQYQFNLEEEERGLILYDVISNNMEKIGTKWNTNSDEIVINNDEVGIWFEVPWGPPTKGIQFLFEQFRDMSGKLIFAEAGGAFCGQTSFYNGEVVDDVDSELILKGNGEEDEDEDGEVDVDGSDINNWEFNRDIDLSKLNSFGG